MFESTQIIGTNQANKALELFDAAVTPLNSGLSFAHSYKWMINGTVALSNGTVVETCPSALGDGFAGGTTDGPGMFNFVQGTNSSSPNVYWNYIASFLSKPSKHQVACQSPKAILLNTGEIDFPALWTPQILPLQVFKIGQFVLIGVPGEFTTMSGRRLRDSVRQTINQYSNKNEDLVVVIAGLSNAYSQYIATPEEYIVQRYEGASTLYGPWTLNFYQQEYSNLAKKMVLGQRIEDGPTPPWLETFNFLPGVIFGMSPSSPPFFPFFLVYKEKETSPLIETNVLTLILTFILFSNNRYWGLWKSLFRCQASLQGRRNCFSCVLWRKSSK